MTVLVVDDNKIAVRLCQRVIEKSGHKVLAASYGLEAVLVILANPPDLVLLDDAMPGMSSLQALRLMKERRPAVPVVIMTVDPSDWNRKRFLAAGAHLVMSKPFRLTDLIAIVAEFAVRPAAAGTPKRLRTLHQELERLVGRAAEFAFWTGQFPVSTAHGRPQVDLAHAATSVTNFLVALIEVSPFLDELARAYGAHGERGHYVPIEELDAWSQVQVAAETELHAVLRMARLAAKKTSWRLLALAQSIAFEADNAGREQREWTWTGAESMFAKYEAPAMDDWNRCDWEELIQGKYMREFEDQSRALMDVLQRLIASPPKPGRPADEIRRPGSAHEEHVYGGFRWCAVCGWIELSATPIEFHTPIKAPADATSGRSHAELKDQTLELVAQALETRDPYTHSHSRRVAELAGRLALQLGLGAREWDLFRTAGSLHDMGKIGIPDDVLQKPGRLSDEEWLIMRRHPDIGADMLEQHAALREIAALVRHHHERWDGSGYPQRLKGVAIPLGARVIAVAESFDYLTMPPTFIRQPLDEHEALRDIRKRSGSWYDPAVVTALHEIHRHHQS